MKRQPPSLAAPSLIFANKLCLYAAWGMSLVSLVLSLYLSEARHVLPCALCWYQRIFMYPLVIIFPIGILMKDKYLPYYAIWLSALGGIIALYQTLLQWHVIPEKASPCIAGISCATPTPILLPFITIPFLSFLAFGTIITLMIIELRRKNP